MFSTGSLQNLCLFKVVQQLEYYPPELLACLPPTLRRLLLVHLPVIDVCKLTNTCVFDGIDPETIWEQLYNQNIPRYFATDEIFPLCDINKLSIEKAHTSFRERFLAVLANIVLNRGRPTGYFSAIKNEYSSIYGRICFTNPPPPSVLSIAPVDIVNTLIAGEKITTVQVLEAEDEEDDSNSDSDEECVFSLAEDGDFNITAVTDYYDSDKYALHRNHCALTDDRDWGHDHNEPTQYFLDYHCTYKDTNERCLSTPHRYSSYAHHKNNYCLSDEDAITLLMRECKYYPKYLSLSVLAFNSKVWAPNLLSQFLCHLVTLEFVFNGQFVCNTEDGAPCEQLLMAILSNASPSLSSLEFTSDTYNEYCLSYDEDEFEAAYVTDNHLALLVQLSELSPPTLSSLMSPLCMLRELSLSGVFTDEGLTNLGTFISRQKTLASLYLESLNVKLHTNTQNVRLIEGCVCSRKFVDALICLFQSPYFENVSLKCVKVEHAMLQDLVVGFLTSSCTHPQKLVLESIEIECETKVSGNSECQLCVPDSASQYKSFEFSVKEPDTFYKSQDDATYILQWFFSLKPLKLFSLKYYCWKYHVHVDCVPLFVQNTSFHVKNLSFCQCGSIFVEEIQNLLRNDTLKSLELKFCSGMIAIEHIAEHILKPVSRSSLEELKITEDIRTDRISYTQPFSQESMSLFSDTLFSLPRLNQLTLEICVLRYNQLYRNIREFIEILHESWKKNGGPKLKRFVLYAPKDHRYILDGYKLKDQEAALQMAHEIGLHLQNDTCTDT